jgi:phage terminase large subunit
MDGEISVNNCYIPFLHNENRYAVLKGGAGSGKSIAAIQKIILRTTTERNHRILCIRKVATTIRNSIYQLLIDKLLEYDIYSEFTINKSEMRFTHTPTGNEILCAGMDDAEKIKSIAGITSVWCEEATELDELDFNQLELRVRGETSNYKQFIITFNPISEQHWLKRRFFDAPDDDTYVLHTTYKDNAFLDADYIKHLTERVKANPNLHKVYVLGEWGKVDFGGEFLKSWSTIKHTRQVSYDPTLAVWLSFDENVNPYFPCGVFQISDDNEVRMLDCLALKNPDNTVKAMARAILQLLRHWKHTGHVYVCGDSTSQKDDVKQEKGFDLFRLLITELDEVKPIRRVSKSNPNVRPSADFFNAILAYNEQGISFVADESCRVAILDFENTKEDKNGKVDKKTVLDPVTKVSYQPYGHIVDLTRYLLTSVFASQYARFQTGIIKPLVVVGKDAEWKSASRF